MTATAFALAAAFDLLCLGTTQKTVGHIKQQPTSETNLLRIDLASVRWCGGQCKETITFAAVEDRKLTLINQNEALVTTFMTISRESGAYYFYQRLGDDVTISNAQCERRPFSGFPARKF